MELKVGIIKGDGIGPEIVEATTNEENERIQEIEIYYRFIGKVD